MMPPCVSVIVPTFNRAEYLPRAIKSVFAQTFQDFEVVVVDDGSTDDTERYVGKLLESGHRVEFFRHSGNLGAQAARNTGIRKSRGEWIAFLDSDDEWLPNRLQSGLDLQRDSELKVIHSECYVRKEGGADFQKMGLPPLSGIAPSIARA